MHLDCIELRILKCLYFCETPENPMGMGWVSYTVLLLSITNEAKKFGALQK